MSEDKKLYIITRDIEEDDVCEEKFWEELLIFCDFDEALNKLDETYENTPDFKHFNYHIKVYDKIGKKYVLSNRKYHKIGKKYIESNEN